MKISYAITVCNEFDEIQRLILFLLENKRNEDEIVILYDINNGHEGIEQFLKAKSINGEISWIPGEFNGHFADWKNKLTSLCTGDYIYQIDADEMVNKDILQLLPQVLEQNDIDVLMVCRINTVEGLTQEHIDKWGWNVNNQGWINFPDPQFRIYKNNKKIKWKNKVHEVLEGYKTISYLPTDEEWCLIHKKNIKRQEQQNAYYSTL
jgi:GT2 family glycosyltransferase